MQVEFPFIKEKATVTKYILRPFVKVNFNGILEWLYFDSGADITLVTLSFGKLLGFKLKEGEEIKELKGIGDGKIPYVIRSVKMKIGENEFDCRIAWSLVEDVPMVLGRLDVFNKFDILVKEREKKIIFTDKSIRL